MQSAGLFLAGCRLMVGLSISESVNRPVFRSSVSWSFGPSVGRLIGRSVGQSADCCQWVGQFDGTADGWLSFFCRLVFCLGCRSEGWSVCHSVVSQSVGPSVGRSRRM